MRFSILRHVLLIVASAGLITAQATLYRTPCPVVDAGAPAPSRLGTLGSSYVKDAINNTLLQILTASKGLVPYWKLDANTTAFTVQVYSAASGEVLFNYSYYALGLADAYTVGAKDIDTDTVFRLGSVSKMWTVYIFLQAAGDRSWNDPITDYVPELAAVAASKNVAENSVEHVDWSSVTVGSLASQLSGIARDAGYSGTLQTALASLGMPNSGDFDNITCGSYDFMIPCNRTALFETFSLRRPVFPSYTSPAYSNAAFVFLAYALENITGTSMAGLFQKYLVQPLNLTGTYYKAPSANVTARGMIPYSTSVSWWSTDILEMAPAGSYFSTLDDMRKVGSAMLLSTQLSPVTTRRWFQPHAFLSNPRAAIGAPWEILRAPDSPGAPSSWMYTKLGDFGMYSSMVVLMPELSLGFNVLSAGNDTTNTVRIVSDIVSETWVPAMRAAAAAEASAQYAGVYVDSITRSSLTVVLNSSLPGLTVTEWFYHGINVLDFLGTLQGINTTYQQVVMNLYPSGLQQNASRANTNSSMCPQTEVGWIATFEALPSILDPGPFSHNCISWQDISNLIYGGLAMDQFVFLVDCDGNAVSLSPVVLEQAQLRNGSTQLGRRHTGVTMKRQAME